MENDPLTFLRAIDVKITASMEALKEAVEEMHKMTKTTKSSSSAQGLGLGQGFGSSRGRGCYRGIDLEGVLDTVSSSTADLCDYTTEGGYAGAPLRKELLERGDVYTKAVREIGQCQTE